MLLFFFGIVFSLCRETLKTNVHLRPPGSGKLPWYGGQLGTDLIGHGIEHGRLDLANLVNRFSAAGAIKANEDGPVRSGESGHSKAGA